MELDVEGAFYGDLERLPDAQNVATPYETLLSSRARLSYSNLRSSLGHVDDEKGLAWNAVFEGDLVNGGFFPRLSSDLDLGFPLALKHSSLWLRSSAGFSPKDPADPFANFFFGGFGNNWVDFRNEKRYREAYAFPGAELNEIAGRNYVKAMLEDEAMAPPYLFPEGSKVQEQWLHGFLKIKPIIRFDPRGRPYYWIDGDLITSDEEGTDVQTVYQDRKISLTPLTLDSTARVDLRKMNGLF